MPKGHIDYGRLVEQALRAVVRDVLNRLASEGLPAPHHFYITFRTNSPGVEIADFLRDRYPVEMTIVLQYQFWDLEVDDEGFAVTLSFNEVPQRLRIPYSAIKVFADPGAEFGLQFTIEADSEVVSLNERTSTSSPEKASEGATAPSDATKEEGPAPQQGSAEIVALDAFRRK